MIVPLERHAHTRGHHRIWRDTVAHSAEAPLA